MSPPYGHGKTITVIRETPGGFDPYGDPTAGTTTETDVDGVAVSPRVQGAGKASGNIEDRGREGVIVGLTAYLPYGSDVRHTDKVRVAGAVYKIEGDPGDWANPITGSTPGIEIQLSRAEG
jgi:hypothetical protein